MRSEKCPHPYLYEHSDYNIKADYVYMGACKMLILKWWDFPRNSVMRSWLRAEAPESGSLTLTPDSSLPAG